MAGRGRKGHPRGAEGDLSSQDGKCVHYRVTLDQQDGARLESGGIIPDPFLTTARGRETCTPGQGDCAVTKMLRCC